MPVKLIIDKNGKLGIYQVNIKVKNLEKLGYYNFSKEEFGFFESIPFGINRGRPS